MKEASGELSMTAVAVVAIAAIGVVFTTLIWPAMRNNIQAKLHCSAASCDTSTCADGYCQCFYCDDEACQNRIEVRCPDNARDA
ncbi:MAG: hypothetical protein Q4C33_00015 [bacterium]|nr:hypothetical protein [bacterium]